MELDGERPRASIQAPLLSAGADGPAAPPPRWLAAAVFLALLFVQISNAAYGVITKLALHGKGGVNPLVFSLFRDGLSFPILELIALVTLPVPPHPTPPAACCACTAFCITPAHKRHHALLSRGGLWQAVDGFQLPARGDVGRFVCLGIFGMFGNQFCYILGLVYIDAGLASVINLLTPVCAWCFATAIGLDRFSWLQAAGVCCAVVRTPPPRQLARQWAPHSTRASTLLAVHISAVHISARNP